MKSRLDRIVKAELCLGCGFCESLGKNDCYAMTLRLNGFYYPQYPSMRNRSIEKVMARVCPATNIVGSSSKNVWGHVVRSCRAWANDPETRMKGSSGGVISCVCTFLLDQKLVDGILHVGRDRNHFLHNQLHISRNKEEILEHASSRYAPARVLNELVQILDRSDETYGFVGKPCDILAVRNFVSVYPKYRDRIRYFLALFCAGMPSYNATLDLLKQSGKKKEPISVRYRGNGWPGNFEAVYDDDSVFRVSYADSWGSVLGRQVHFRCKICPDAIGLLADISVGDAWETIAGYPDFQERPGRSFVLVRNEKTDVLIQDMINKNILIVEKLDLHELSEIQQYHYQRRLYAGYRLFPIQLLSGFLFKLKDLKLMSLMKQLSFIKGARAVLGVIKRAFNRNNYYRIIS